MGRSGGRGRGSGWVLGAVCCALCAVAGQALVKGQQRARGQGRGAAGTRGKQCIVSVGEVYDEQDKDVPRATATATAKMQNSD